MVLIKYHTYLACVCLCSTENCLSHLISVCISVIKLSRWSSVILLVNAFYSSGLFTGIENTFAFLLAFITPNHLGEDFTPLRRKWHLSFSYCDPPLSLCLFCVLIVKIVVEITIPRYNSSTGSLRGKWFEQSCS